MPDFHLRSVLSVVYDEADRLFEMGEFTKLCKATTISKLVLTHTLASLAEPFRSGFAQQLRDISRTMPESRQTMLFSATMPKMLVEFARAGLQDPQLIRLDSEAGVSEELRLSFLTCRSTDKDATLLYLLREVSARSKATSWECVDSVPYEAEQRRDSLNVGAFFLYLTTRF